MVEAAGDAAVISVDLRASARRPAIPEKPYQLARKTVRRLDGSDPHSGGRSVPLKEYAK